MIDRVDDDEAERHQREQGDRDAGQRAGGEASAGSDPSGRPGAGVEARLEDGGVAQSSPASCIISMTTSLLSFDDVDLRRLELVERLDRRVERRRPG